MATLDLPLQKEAGNTNGKSAMTIFGESIAPTLAQLHSEELGRGKYLVPD